jgi:hypothetical protein
MIKDVWGLVYRNKDLFVKNLRNPRALNETVRERKSGRALGRKENRGGGYGEGGLLPPLNRTERGVDREAGRWRGKGCRRPRPWGQSGGGAKQKGGRGQPIPLLTLVGDVL